MVTHVVGILRRGLIEGRWQDGLPGERRLAAQLGVSRPTLRKALVMLRAAGLLKIAHGKISKPTRKAIRRAVEPISKTVLVLAPEPLHRLPSAAVFAFDELRSDLAEAGLRLEVRAFHPSTASQSRPALDALLSSEHPAVWLLYQQGRPVHRWVRERALPCVVFGTQDQAFPLPAVDLDQRATCRHAAQFLLRRGYVRSRIALIFPGHGLPGHALMSDGLRDALGEEARIFQVPLAPEELPGALDKILAQIGRPAACIFARARHAAGALGHFAIRRRLQVPEDVAVICLNDDPFLRYLHPPIARYERDSASIARHLSALVVRAATGPQLQPRMTLVMPDFIEGETVPKRNLRSS